eukprot:gb/GECG01012411.1/.p1 GENE.gb/GECG01012411.1/~~gb/GECG01012411.1/.p1  ORF type:complete len:285 (+),score=11.72 gb/GECG01012411.1/:1-855(+)
MLLMRRLCAQRSILRKVSIGLIRTVHTVFHRAQVYFWVTRGRITAIMLRNQYCTHRQGPLAIFTRGVKTQFHPLPRGGFPQRFCTSSRARQQQKRSHSGSTLTPYVLGGGGLIPFAWFSAAACDKDVREWSKSVLKPLYGFTGTTDDVIKLFEPRSPEQSCVKLAYYGASILSFMGAIHWGTAMVSTAWSARSRALSYGISTIPSLVAWGSLASLVGVEERKQNNEGCRSALVGQAVGFASVFWYDLVTISNGKLPRWYISLRIPLTLGALVSLTLPVLSVKPQ